jgi:hypothetical protein
MPVHMRGGETPGEGPILLWLATPTAGRRRVGRAVLAEAALACRGWVEELPAALLLRGASPDRTRRLRDLLDRILGGALLVAAPDPPPDLPGLDAWLDALDPLLVARRRAGWRLAAPASGPDFLRLEIGRAAVAGLLGPLGADGDLLAHAGWRLQGALLRVLADPARRRALLGEAAPARLHLRLPEGTRGGAPGLVATLGLAAAADPGELAARRAALAACGTLLEIEGLDAAALALLDPAALPADLLRLAWSPALAGVTLPRDVAARTVLAGAEEPAAQAWARRQGIALVESDTAPP